MTATATTTAKTATATTTTATSSTPVCSNLFGMLCQNFCFAVPGFFFRARLVQGLFSNSLRFEPTRVITKTVNTVQGCYAVPIFKSIQELDN